MQEEDVFAALKREERISHEGGRLSVKPKEPAKNYEVLTYCNGELVNRLAIEDPFITTTIGPVLTGRTFVRTIINRLRGCLDCLRGKLVYRVEVLTTNSETMRAVMNLAHICDLCEPAPRLWRGEFARERLNKHQWAVHGEEMARPSRSRFLREINDAQRLDSAIAERTVPKVQLDALLKHVEEPQPLSEAELEILKGNLARQTPMTKDERDEERRVAAEFAARLKRREEDSK